MLMTQKTPILETSFGKAFPASNWEMQPQSPKFQETTESLVLPALNLCLASLQKAGLNSNFERMEMISHSITTVINIYFVQGKSSDTTPILTPLVK